MNKTQGKKAKHKNKIIRMERKRIAKFGMYGQKMH